MMTMCSINLI